MSGLKLETERLELVAGGSELIQAELFNRASLGQLLNARVPDTWPPELFVKGLLKFIAKELIQTPAESEWLHWYWIQQGQTAAERVLIGVSGFSPPTEDGTIEIAYSMLEEFWGFGYATEASKRLIAWAFSQPEVSRIVAETLPEKIPSIHVLERNGFCKVDEASDKGIIVYWFELTRAQYEETSHKDLPVVKSYQKN